MLAARARSVGSQFAEHSSKRRTTRSSIEPQQKRRVALMSNIWCIPIMQIDASVNSQIARIGFASSKVRQTWQRLNFVLLSHGIRIRRRNVYRLVVFPVKHIHSWPIGVADGCEDALRSTNRCSCRFRWHVKWTASADLPRVLYDDC